MLQFYKIGFMCIIITCLTLTFAQTVKKHTSKEDSSNISTTGYSTNFSKERHNDVEMEYVKKFNVSQSWKSMETIVINVLTGLYNTTMPFMSQINKDLDISSTCKTDLMKMLTGIKEFKYWAVQMLDSFGKIPSGIETGTVSSLGDFDQCLDVVVPGHFQGQYCNLDLILPLPKRQPFVASNIEVPELMNVVKPDGFFRVFGQYGRLSYFVKPRVSICVPSTCSKDELQKIANKAVRTMDLPFGLKIPNCEVWNEGFEFDRSEIAILIILGVLLFLVVIATAFDVFLKSILKEEENGKNYLSLPTKYLLCFSLHANAKRLFAPDTEKDSIKIFHGMRVLTTLWVIGVHCCFYQSFGATGRMLHIFKKLRQIPFHIFANGFMNVQTFFFMSATLHAFRFMKKKENINIKRHILRRIWRLAPTFMLVIACVILLPQVGSGPVWKETVKDLLADNCRKRWWTNFLFINNFLRKEDMCLDWLWYIAVDFQLYVCSLLVLIPIKKCKQRQKCLISLSVLYCFQPDIFIAYSNPTLGFTINFLIMIGAMLISAALHVYYNLTPMLVIAFTNPERIKDFGPVSRSQLLYPKYGLLEKVAEELFQLWDVNYFLERGYFRTYLHCSSICIGLVVGYFLVNRPPKLRISWKISAPLWLASLCVCLLVLFGAYYWIQGHIPSIGISVLYAGGSKILWTLAMAWITIACMTGNGGIVNKILSLPVFVPLDRLCYMVYLIHSLIHYMYVGSTRMYIRGEVRAFLHMYLGTILASFLCAVPLTLIFESPFMAMDKLIFPEKQSERAKRSKPLQKIEEESLKNGDVKDMNSAKKVA